nr:hypothetical protein [Tanacetum cinerariifolium]
MIELRADLELKDTIVVAVPKFNSKMPCQPSRGPPVGLKPKSTFVYRLVSTKKATKANGNSKLGLMTLKDNVGWKTLMLVDDDGKPLEMDADKPTSIPSTSSVASKKVVDESESDIEDIYDETAQYMASGGENNASFLKDEDFDT